MNRSPISGKNWYNELGQKSNKVNNLTNHIKEVQAMLDTKILVVDDDANICDLLKLYFENEGYEVKTANDGMEGISYTRYADDFIISAAGDSAQDRLQIGMKMTYQTAETLYLNRMTVWGSTGKWRVIARAFRPWDDVHSFTFHHSTIFDY